MNTPQSLARHKRIVIALLLILVVIAVLIFMPGPTRSGATIVIDPQQLLNQAGQTWTARIMIDSNLAVNSVDTTITYDPRLVELRQADIEEADFEMKIFEPAIDSDKGTVRFVQTSLQSHTGQGSLIGTLTFKGRQQGQMSLSASQTKIVADDGKGTNVYHSSLNQTVGQWLLGLVGL